MQKSPADKLRGLMAECAEHYDHWQNVRQNGCNDPTWSDGVNLNLIRNHIIHAKREIKSLCDNFRLVIPAIYFRPLPLTMRNDFYVITGKWYETRTKNRNLKEAHI